MMGLMLTGMPDLSPMLAQTCSNPFDDDDWLFEVKWDGYRCLSYIRNSEVFLRSRNGYCLNKRFAQLESISGSVNHSKVKNLIVDGEIVGFEEGKPSFSSLKTNPGLAVYVIFDLVFLNDQLLLDIPLVERRRKLYQLFDWGGLIYFSQAQEQKGYHLFDFIKQRGMEGIMAKRKDSLYFPGERTYDWLKIKNVNQQDFWVIGYLSSPGRKIGSLVVAKEQQEEQQNKQQQAQQVSTGSVYEPCGRTFSCVGCVSSGLNEKIEKQLLAAFGPSKSTRHMSIEGKLSKSVLRKVQWIEPYFGVRVEYTEITPSGKLRHPVLKAIF